MWFCIWSFCVSTLFSKTSTPMLLPPSPPCSAQEQWPGVLHGACTLDVDKDGRLWCLAGQAARTKGKCCRWLTWLTSPWFCHTVPNRLLPTTEFHLSHDVKQTENLLNLSSSMNTGRERVLDSKLLWHSLTEGFNGEDDKSRLQSTRAGTASSATPPLNERLHM